MLLKVCISGSSSFKDEILSIASYLERHGIIVFASHTFSHHDNETLSTRTIRKLHDVHNAKIQMSDIMVVVNPDGRIGASTLHEIEFATSIGKEIVYQIDPEAYNHNPVDFNKVTDQKYFPEILKSIKNTCTYKCLLDYHILSQKVQ